MQIEMDETFDYLFAPTLVTEWDVVNVVATQRNLREKSKLASKEQLEELVNDFYTCIIKSCVSEESPLGIVSEFIDNWHPTDINIIEFTEISGKEPKKLKNSDHNCYKEYNESYDSIYRQGRILERLNMIPAPIKLYIAVFGLLLGAFVALILLYFLKILTLFPPYYMFLGLLCSSLLMATSIYGFKEWKKRGKIIGKK